MSESENEDDGYPEWVMEYMDEDEQEIEEYDPLPEWAVRNEYERTDTTCPRCHGKILRHHEISFSGYGDSIVRLRCSNYENGCGYSVEAQPQDEYEDS